MPHLDEQARYAITIEGPVDQSLADWCGPFTMVQERAPEGAPITRLDGIVTDQAGLVGIIRRLHGLGVVLLCVERCTVERCTPTA